MAKLAISVALSLIAGLLAGNEIGATLERSTIANSCKYGGTFTIKRTGFTCAKIGTKLRIDKPKPQTQTGAKKNDQILTSTRG